MSMLRSIVVPDERSYKYTSSPPPLAHATKPDGGLTVLKRTSPILRALQNPTAASLYYLHFQSAVHACACHKIRRRPKGTTCTFRLQALQFATNEVMLARASKPESGL